MNVGGVRTSGGLRGRAGSSGRETVGLIVMAALPLLGALHLVAAQLATRVAGTPPLQAGLADGVVALARLWFTPGEPKLAWDHESSAALPDPMP